VAHGVTDAEALWPGRAACRRTTHAWAWSAPPDLNRAGLTRAGRGMQVALGVRKH
jgi:hypothetical protein